MLAARLVNVIVVHMDEGTLHLGDGFQLALKTLADVVGVPQGHGLGQDNVNLRQQQKTSVSLFVCFLAA